MPFVCTSPVDGHVDGYRTLLPGALSGRADGLSRIHSPASARPSVRPTTYKYSYPPKTFRLSYTLIRPSALGNVPAHSSLCYALLSHDGHLLTASNTTYVLSPVERAPRRRQGALWTRCGEPARPQNTAAYYASMPVRFCYAAERGHGARRGRTAPIRPEEIHG